MDKELENRLLGIAITKGEWYAAQQYLYKELKYSINTSWDILKEIHSKNADLGIPILRHAYAEHNQ